MTMIITFIYKNNNSDTKYYGKYIGYVSDSYSEGLDRQVSLIVYDVLKGPLNLCNIDDLIIGVIGFNRDTYDYFSEEESKIFDLLYCNWSNEPKEVYIKGVKI